MKRFVLIPSIVALLLVTACQKPTTSRPELTDAEVRAEEMAQQRLVNEIAAQGGTKKTWKSKKGMRTQFERVAERIEEAGAEICRGLGLPAQGKSCYYHFDIEYEDKLNAYADGKKIVFYSGMLRFLDGDDEIAAVMGHELAHNLMSHVEASGTNQMAGAFVGLLIDAVAASQGVSTGGAFGDMGQTVGHLSYSVDFEEEADYVGLYVAARAGYDINKAPDVWRRMSLEDPDGIYNSTTHPSNAARYVALNKTINEINAKRTRKQPLLPEREKLEE